MVKNKKVDPGSDLFPDVPGDPVMSGPPTKAEQTAAEAAAAGLPDWTAKAAPAKEDATDLWSGPSWQNNPDDDDWTGPDLTEVFGKEAVVETPKRKRPARKNPVERAKRPLKSTKVREGASKKTAPVAKVSPPTREAKKVEQKRVAASATKAEPTQRAKRSSIAKETASQQKKATSRTRLQATQAGKIVDSNPADEQIFETVTESEEIELTAIDTTTQVQLEPEQRTIIPDSGGRNLPVAIAVGAALACLAVAALSFSAEATLLLVGLIALLAVAEFYTAMRSAKLRPATLLGLVGTVALPAAAFYRGDSAFPLVLGLTVVFGALWYLVGADNERPVLNLSLTLMGLYWIGGLAGFAGLMLYLETNAATENSSVGRQLIAATIAVTAASDIMAYFGGKAYGSTPFHVASPNKTWEGTITGFLGAMFVGFLLALAPVDGFVFSDDFAAAVAFGAIVGLMAMVGDLAESLIKRDLNIKDMGTILPGHGGILDRIDGLLFALPGAYYTATLFGLI